MIDDPLCLWLGIFFRIESLTLFVCRVVLCCSGGVWQRWTSTTRANASLLRLPGMPISFPSGSRRSAWSEPTSSRLESRSCSLLPFARWGCLHFGVRWVYGHWPGDFILFFFLKVLCPISLVYLRYVYGNCLEFFISKTCYTKNQHSQKQYFHESIIVSDPLWFLGLGVPGCLLSLPILSQPF